jgi:hypothetical protein
MSALGQKQTLHHVRPMSALPPKADIAEKQLDVRFVPKADSLDNAVARRHSLLSFATDLVVGCLEEQT